MSSFDSNKNQSLRDKLVDVGETQMKQNQQVTNMNRMMEDTQQKAQAGLEKLYQQGNQLDRINQKYMQQYKKQITNLNLKQGKEITYEINKVDRTTESMRKRQYYMNCLLYFVAICLFVAIVVLLGIRISKRLK